MFKIRSLDLYNWGYLPWQTVPLHTGVNVCVGDNGSGKSTFLDAIKLLLGSNEFAKNRRLHENLHPDADVAWVMATVDNRRSPASGRRPLESLAVLTDEAVLCCRMERKGGQQFAKEHWISTAPFDPAAPPGEPFSPQGYREALERLGVSRTLLRAINLPQGETARLVEKQPHELFDYLLDLVGDKAILDRYEEARQAAARERQAYATVMNQVQGKRGELAELRQRKEAFEEFARNEAELAEAQRLQPMAEYREALEAWRSKARHADQLEPQRASLAAELEEKREELKRVRAALTQAEARYDEVRDQLERVNHTLQALAEGIGRLGADLRQVEGFLAAYEGIEDKDPDRVLTRLAGTTAERDRLIAEERGLEQRLSALTDETRPLEEAQSLLPRNVDRFREVLRAEGIHHVLAADAIEITDERWLDALEALFGDRRLDVFVGPQDFLLAKRLAAQHQYPYYVARVPLAEPQAPAGPGTAASLVTFTGEQVLAGAYRWLRDVYLVEDVDEGHLMAEQGKTALTPDGYLQDGHGGISILHRADRRYCGRLARQRQLAKLQEERQRLNQQLAEIHPVRERAANETEKLKAAAELLAAHPQRLRECNRIAGDLDELRRQQGGAEGERNRLRDEEGRLRTQTRAFNGQISELEGSIKGQEGRLKQMSDQIKELRTQARDLEDTLERLRAAISHNDFAKLPEMELESATTYSERARLLQRRVEDYRAKYPDESPAVVQLYESKRTELEDLEAQVRRRSEELHQVEEQLGRAREEHDAHVREVFRLMGHSFRELCARIGAVGELRAIGGGENDRWHLDVRIAFEGKEMVPYRSRKLSGGQDAALSLLLLTSAIQLGTTLQLMIFDEHIAHLDEVGARIPPRAGSGGRTSFPSLNFRPR